MTARNLLSVAALLAAAAFPTLASAQAHLPNLKDRLKVHKERLPRPSHRLVVVHPRRLAVQDGKERHQVRVVGTKNRHKIRAGTRTVTHKLTKPHHPGRH